jgi:hypothetical protein
MEISNLTVDLCHSFYFFGTLWCILCNDYHVFAVACVFFFYNFCIIGAAQSLICTQTKRL